MHRSSDDILVTERAQAWALRWGPDFDPASLVRLVALDPSGEAELLPRLLVVFEDSLMIQIQAMEAAMARSDAQGMRRAAHTLRSSSASMGLQAFAQACAGLEALAHAQASAPVAAAQAPLIEGAHTWLTQAKELLSRVRALAQAGEGP